MRSWKYGSEKIDELENCAGDRMEREKQRYGIKKSRAALLLWISAYCGMVLAACGENRMEELGQKAESFEAEKEEAAAVSADESGKAAGYHAEELLDAFLAGEVPAFYENEDDAVIMYDQLPHEEDDWECYSTGEWIDLDNDGENELIVNGPYGGIYFDARDGKVYVLAAGEGMAGILSYVDYDSATWIIHSDTLHAGREKYWLTRYDGGGNIVDEFELGAEYWDSVDDQYDENSDFTYRGEKISMREFEELREEIFGG